MRAWTTGRGGRIRLRVPGSMPIHHVWTDSVHFGTESGCPVLELSLALVAPGAGPGWPEELDLFLSGDSVAAWSLRHLLLRRLASVDVVGGRGSVRIRSSSVAGPSVAASDSAGPLLDLRDLLCADERFRYLRLAGLGSAVPEGATRAKLRFRIGSVHGEEVPIGLDSVRLLPNCCTLVNLHRSEMQPQRMEVTRAAYPLSGADEEAEVVDLEDLRGASQADPSRAHAYVRSWELRHSGMRETEPGTVRVRFQPNRAGRPRASLSVHHRDPEFFFPDEVLTGTVWCCDGDAPSEKVAPADIADPGSGIPSGLGVRGLSGPAQLFRPSPGPEFGWRMLAHFQASFMDLVDAQRLRDLLGALLWDPRGARKHLVEGIRSVEVAPGRALLPGGGVRSVWEIRVGWADASGDAPSWETLGRLDALASLLQALWAGRTPPGTSCRLALRMESTGTVLEHPA